MIFILDYYALNLAPTYFPEFILHNIYNLQGPVRKGGFGCWNLPPLLEGQKSWNSNNF